MGQFGPTLGERLILEGWKQKRRQLWLTRLSFVALAVVIASAIKYLVS